MEKRFFCLTSFLFNFFCFCSLFVFSACNNSTFLDIFKNPHEETVTFVLPKWPPEFGNDELYPELKSWKIIAKNQPVQKIGNDVQSLDFSVEKNEPFYVIALPCTKLDEKVLDENYECSFFYGAGGIYPYSAVFENGSKTVEITWEQGFSATIMDKVYISASNFYSYQECDSYLIRFNWKKMIDSIQKKMSDSFEDYSENINSPEKIEKLVFYNPWNLDSQELIKGITGNAFSATLLNQKNCFSVIGTKENQLKNEYLSPFIPENQIICDYSSFSLKKNDENNFSVYNLYQMIIRGSSAKNLSIEYIFLPINKEDLL